LLLRNAEFASRLLSLLLGSASVWLEWKISRTIYGEAAGIFSLAVFALYSLHIGYSTTSSSESPYLFFVLAGLACFFIFQQTDRISWLALSGICLTLGAAIRYEAWIIMLGVGLALAISPVASRQQKPERAERFSRLLVFALTAGLWPAFFMLYSWVKWGNPLYTIGVVHALALHYVASFPRSYFYRSAFVPGVLLVTLSPLVIIAAIYALGSTIRNRAGLQFAVVLATLAIVQFCQIISGGQGVARYSLSLGTLLAIASGYGLERLIRRLPSRYWRTSRAVVIAALVLNLGAILALSEAQWRFSDKFASISPRLRFTRHLQDVGAELGRRLDSGDAVVIDNYNVESNQIAAVAGLPLLASDRVLDASVERQDLRADLWKFMETKQPKYLVYSDRGVLRPFLPLAGGCPANPVLSNGIEFQCSYANEIYTLYEVRYPVKQGPHGEEVAIGSANE
jgi:4-amino-4-deoxy-L-arabinose transferase-like glycosyltransferase